MARGYTYLQLGKNMEAIGDFDKALSFNPNDGNAYLNRSQANYLLKNYKQAASDVQTAMSLGVQVDPNYKNQIDAAAK